MRSRKPAPRARPAERIGWPAACVLRLASARSTRSWAAACTPTWPISSASVPRFTRRFISSILPTRLSRRWPLKEMHYSIRHLTRFRYDAAISESVMELRMQPRSEGGQRCSSFELSIKPRANVGSYHDQLGNLVHHFDIPGHHTNLTIKAEARVEIIPQTLPTTMTDAAWPELDQLLAEG